MTLAVAWESAAMHHSPPRTAPTSPRIAATQTPIEPEITAAAAPHAAQRQQMPHGAPPVRPSSAPAGALAARAAPPHAGVQAGPTEAELEDILRLGDAAFETVSDAEFGVLLEAAAAIFHPEGLDALLRPPHVAATSGSSDEIQPRRVPPAQPAMPAQTAGQPATRDELGLGPRPTTPELPVVTSTSRWRRGCQLVQAAASGALQGEQSQALRDRLARQEISLQSNDPTSAQAHGTGCASSVTPIFEAAEREVLGALGLLTPQDRAVSTLQLAPEQVARLVAAAVDAKLGQLDAAEHEEGPRLTAQGGAGRKLGCYSDGSRWTTRHGSGPVRQEAETIARLAKDYALAADANAPETKQKMSEAERLEQQRAGSTLIVARRLLALVEQHGADGPLAAAFFLSTSRTGEMQPKESTALLAALEVNPQGVHKLVDAAHRDRDAANASSTELLAAARKFREDVRGRGSFADPARGGQYFSAVGAALHRAVVSPDGIPGPLHPWLLAQPPSGR